MTRKKRDISKKRESILDAAVEAFCQEGYESASMDQIAEFAGASKRTVYNHFASKELLFGAVFERFVEETRALKVIPYEPGKKLEAQLGKFVDAKLAIFKNPAWLGLTRVALTMLIQDSQIARASMARYKAGERSFEDWLESAIADKRLAVPDLELGATLFWSMVMGSLVLPQLMTGSFTTKQSNTLKKELIATFVARYRY
ncbi:MAG: TetR/AcrR family transcriptional regulator [Kofleriaceae bacterium]|nr:TetR/AcrR family transcriptional regulator [Kofleriaceae bacterium]